MAIRPHLRQRTSVLPSSTILSSATLAGASSWIASSTVSSITTETLAPQKRFLCSVAPHVHLIQELTTFCPTSKMSHGLSGRGSCLILVFGPLLKNGRG